MASVSSKINQLWGWYFFWKCSKLNRKLENWKRNWDNIFCFWENSIRKCWNKFPLLRREYFLSALNGLTKCPKILHITQRDFFNLNCLQRDRWIWQRCCRSAFNSFSLRLPCHLSKGPLKRDFLDIYLTTSFGVHNFKNASAMRVIFFLEMFKIESKFRKGKKKLENIFRFWDNCIWKCCYKLPLLRRWCLSSAVNGWRNRAKILHIIQRDFFNRNCLHRDHWIW